MTEDDRIVPWAEYGQHIKLYCKNHTELRWHTKNISPIGARTIFFDSPGKLECNCSISLLVPVENKENW